MKIALYMHGGSGNHGCEALVRTVSALVSEFGEVSVFSKEPSEDKKYIENVNTVSCGQPLPKNTFAGFVSAVKMKFLKQKLAYVKPAYKSLLKFADKDTLAISIGGDNYCYDGMPEVLALLNKELKKKGAKTVLFGCSIEPELLKDTKVVEDLSNYDLITARESITYDALKNAGVKTDVVLFPDSAFTLPTEKRELPVGFLENDTVGLNISPLVLSCEEGEPILLKAYCRLMEYILENTSMNIALIPHVVWQGNNDNEPIKILHEKYKNTGRVAKVEDCNATELKGYIARCRFFVGARTHATIAAYSNCVPTLVVGYSVKSRGIAKDLFGTEENYVRSVKDIRNEEDLVDSFIWLMKNEQNIKAHLVSTMPEYIQQVYALTKKMEDLGKKIGL